MFQKYKQLMVGIIIGGLLFSIPVLAEKIFVTAELSDIKINVNGLTLNLENQPLMYNDRTYLPLREIGTAVGMTVGYDEASDTAILTNGNNPAPTPAPIPTESKYPIPEVTPDSPEYFTTVDGINMRIVDGQYCVFTLDILGKLSKMGYNNYAFDTTSFFDANNIDQDIFSNIPYVGNGNSYIPIDYYYSTLLPWIKALPIIE